MSPPVWIAGDILEEASKTILNSVVVVFMPCQFSGEAALAITLVISASRVEPGQAQNLPLRIVA